MSQHQYQEMYQEYLPSRSPGSTRGYNGATLGRSRPFDNYGQPLQGLYTAEDHAAQYNTRRFDNNPTVSAMPSNYGYDNQTWNYGGVNGGPSTLGGRMKPPSRRAGIPNAWLDSDIPPVPQMNMPQMNGQYLNSMQNSMQNPPRITPPAPPEPEEIIPTAIVIKNIPFAVKKEALTDFMGNMGLPLPYAFNYHFDNGVFRGLAFANYTTAEETAVVIDRMNHADLSGRKLRVEYKKMLPAAERDRIERDKRERRGQLQEQHQPLSNSSLHNQGSMNSMNSMNSIIPTASPSPISGRSDGKFLDNIDMNDPVILGFYTELMLFKGDTNRETFIFPSTVTPAERRIIHTLAHHMGLEHRSEGSGEMRQVQILRARPQVTQPTPQYGSGAYFNESQRRGLNRAATIDFGESRSSDPYYNHTLGRQGSGLLDIPRSPGLGTMSAQNLRAAKSFADLRSYTPSPAPSSASFPANLNQNIARFTDYSLPTASSGTPNLTPTSAGGMPSREDLLLNNMSNMSLGFDRQTGRNGQTGPIGSRPLNGYDESPWKHESAIPERQPRGPGNEWGAGFRPRQNGHNNRGSGELDLNVEKAWNNKFQDSSDRNGPSRFK